MYHSKIVFPLAWKSLKNRKVTSALTVASVALSVCLFLGVEKIRTGARDGFSDSISQTDLIVGARGSPIQLLLYTVFRIGNATNNISWETYEHFKKHKDVAWTIPYSLGDSFRGYRVVATNQSFYENYRFAGKRSIELETGRFPSQLFDVAMGADAAKNLDIKVNDPIVLAHGISEVSFQKHEDKPFRVVGVLKRTGTPIDRSAYITLEGMEAIHMDWGDGSPPLPGQGLKPEDLIDTEIKIGVITAFLLRTNNRIETLRLQREINTFDKEPLTAIIPGVALSELWNNISFAETGLKAVSSFVVVVGLMAMFIALYSSLNERRREMAIYRAIGVSASFIGSLLLIEACLLTLSGALAGVLLSYGTLAVFQSLIQDYLGLHIQLAWPSATEWTYLVVLFVCGTAVGTIPAFFAYKNSLVDGLTIRV